MSTKNNRFNAARFYEVPKGWVPDAHKLKSVIYAPTSPTSELSSGFLPPRGGSEPGDWPFVEVISGLHVVRLRTQSRSVPKSAIDHEVQEMSRRIEQETGRPPGKRQKKDMKDEARLSLLPRAFPKDSDSWGLVCPARGLLVVNSASVTGSAHLPQALVGLHIMANEDVVARGLPTNMYARPMSTITSCEAFMLQALTDPDAIAPFGPATSCALEAQDETKKQVRYRNHELQGNQEVARHLKRGHLPTRLGMYLETHTHFEIDSKMGLHKITFTGDLFQPQADQSTVDDAFDADITLSGLGLLKLYDELVNVLGIERTDDPKPAGLL